MYNAYDEFKRQRECKYDFAKNLYYAIHGYNAPEPYPALAPLLPPPKGGGLRSSKLNGGAKPANNIVDGPTKKAPANKPKSDIKPGRRNRAPAGKPKSVAAAAAGSRNLANKPTQQATSDWKGCMQPCMSSSMQGGSNVVGTSIDSSFLSTFRWNSSMSAVMKTSWAQILTEDIFSCIHQLSSRPAMRAIPRH